MNAHFCRFPFSGKVVYQEKSMSVVSTWYWLYRVFMSQMSIERPYTNCRYFRYWWQIIMNRYSSVQQMKLRVMFHFRRFMNPFISCRWYWIEEVKKINIMASFLLHNGISTSCTNSTWQHRFTCYADGSSLTDYETLISQMCQQFTKSDVNGHVNR